MEEPGFLHKVGGFIVSVVKVSESSAKKKPLKKTHKASSAKMAAKKAKRSSLKSARNAGGRRNRKLAAARARAARRRPVPARRHMRTYARQRHSMSIRKEIMMPAPWSRVEKYKKVKKDNDYSSGY